MDEPEKYQLDKLLYAMGDAADFCVGKTVHSTSLQKLALDYLKINSLEIKLWSSGGLSEQLQMVSELPLQRQCTKWNKARLLRDNRQYWTAVQWEETQKQIWMPFRQLKAKSQTAMVTQGRRQWGSGLCVLRQTTRTWVEKVNLNGEAITYTFT